MALIIVESPTKARTFNRILKGQDYYVFASIGHIRDLPKNKIAIDYSHEFKPDYEIIKGKQKVVDQLKKLAEKNNEIIIATDPDREGESIGYHLAYLIGLMKEEWPNIEKKENGKKLKRIVFHEITKRAVDEALREPTEIRIPLVKAQQARRILDRIVGYELSPLLWTKMGKNWLSAGRVQTVALRLVVEREKEIDVFKTEKYFQIYGLFKDADEFKAKLIKKDEEVFEKSTTISLFAGEYTYVQTSIGDKNVDQILSEAKEDSYVVWDLQEEIVKRYPPPPHTTSLLQQDAFYRFGYPAKMVMRLAQGLYERGLITYHRTDSFNLAGNFVFRAKDFIETTYGKEYALDKPRGFKTRSKSAQEAHEAIRPTKLERTPDVVKKETKLTKNHMLIYELIYKRALAIQMKEAEIRVVKIYPKGQKHSYIFESEVQQVVFDGFLKVLNPVFVKKNLIGINIKKDEKLSLQNLEKEEKETSPPPRYTEASLIKTLEEFGIGRPSTYAPIISLIQDKGYTEKDGRYLKPTNLGTAISDYLSKAFPKIFDINFTASMEDGLDQIANGEKEMLLLLKEFNGPFQEDLKDKEKDKEKIKVEEEIKENCPVCGNPLVAKVSRFGRFIACSTYPECKYTRSILKYVKGKTCPRDGGRIVVRYSKKKRRFYGCENYPKCTFTEFSYLKL